MKLIIVKLKPAGHAAFNKNQFIAVEDETSKDTDGEPVFWYSTIYLKDKVVIRNVDMPANAIYAILNSHPNPNKWEFKDKAWVSKAMAAGVSITEIEARAIDWSKLHDSHE